MAVPTQDVTNQITLLKSTKNALSTQYATASLYKVSRYSSTTKEVSVLYFEVLTLVALLQTTIAC
jgi:hypothetical protein